MDITGTFRLGPLILTSEASDPVWSSRPHSWSLGIQLVQVPLIMHQDHLVPPAYDTCISQALPQICWGPRNLPLNLILQVNLMTTLV